MSEPVASDANATSGTEDVRDAGISSVLGDVQEPRPANADAVSVVDDEPGKVVGAKPGEQAPDEGGTKKDDVKDGEDGKGGKPPEGADDRFDKHPRFQELIQGRNQDKEAIAALKAQVETLTAIASGKEPPKADAKAAADDDTPPPPIPYRDITQMTKEQILEWMEDDPQGYEANRFAQFLHETMVYQHRAGKQSAAKAEQDAARASVQKTYEQYEKDNPDFRPMWDSGEIMKFLDANPGHNPISAHQLLTAEKRVQAAAEKAAKEAEERVVKNFQAKRGAQVLDGGPGRTPAPTEHAELTDTKEKGGLMHVLAGRLQAMRSAAGGG